jgi:membrane fusion protein (multidrug efflux system)
MALRDRLEHADRPAGPSIESPTVAPAAAPQNASDGEAPTRRGNLLRRHPFITGAAIIVILAAIAAGVIWWLHARNYVSTDDAFVDARVVQISPQVSGTAIAVPVTDNQLVDRGTLLARIDARDYRAALQQAQAQLEEAKASVTTIEAQIAAQQADIAQAEHAVTQAKAALQFAQQQYQRAQTLLEHGSGTQQQQQQATSELTQKRAAEAATQSALTAAQKQLAVLQAQRKSAEAKVDAAQAAVTRAQVNLQRTTVEAPEGGHVANLNVAVGNYLQPGQTLMALVPRNVWITANFKETDLAELRVGQPVTIQVDAYPDKTFHGHVASMQAGSGMAFSLLPPQNATGNYVKIVQRVPVKITFDEQPSVYLGPGMSVVPTVKVQ